MVPGDLHRRVPHVLFRPAGLLDSPQARHAFQKLGAQSLAVDRPGAAGRTPLFLSHLSWLNSQRQLLNAANERNWTTPSDTLIGE